MSDFGAQSGVTDRIRNFVRRRFDDPEVALERLGAWRISYEDGLPSERFVAAAVHYADGETKRLQEAFDLAEGDWRDLLVFTGLGDPDWPAVVAARLAPDS